MDITNASRALGALAQGSRLRVFRLLVQYGEDGLAAGRIARALDIPHNTLSSHLGILHRAGLLQSHRKSRSIIYRIDFDGMRELMAFLLEDCCQAQRRFAGPLLDSLTADCRPDQPAHGEQHETPAH